MPRDKGETCGTVTRVIRLLQALAEAEHITLKELSQRLCLPPSTVHRLLQLLMQHDLVERGPDGRHYRSGLEFYRLGSLVLGRTDVADVAEPFLRAVVEACNEVCFLVRYLPAAKRVMIVRSVNSTHALRYDIAMFRPDTMLWGATGRSILAFLPPAELEAVLQQPEKSPVTGQDLPPLDAFRRELAAIREAGYVCTRGQKMPGAVGIGAPVFDSSGHVVAGMCITVPQARFEPHGEAGLAKLVLAYAGRLSMALGYRKTSVRKHSA